MFPLPVEEVMWVRQEELVRDFEQVRLERAARISNPGLLERFLLSMGQFLIETGQHIRAQHTVLPQSYVDSAVKFAS
jgi:hypothetical protein